MQDRFVDEVPFFTEAQRSLAARIVQFVAREIEPRAAEGDDEGARCRAHLGCLARGDVLRYAVPTEGSLLDTRSLCMVRESLSYASSLADLVFVMQGLGTYPLRLGAPQHLRAFWLDRARNGQAIAAFALTEPEAGSDVSAIQTTAERAGDVYVLNGRKRYISNAGLADFYTVFARTGTRADGRAELSAFIVPARLPGLRISSRIEMIAPHPIGEIELADARVPSENLIGSEGDGFRLAMQTMDAFRASVGAAACGMARRALDEALAYAKTRRQFGQPLTAHQLIQEKLADMATELDAARLLVFRAAFLRDSSARATREASQAKLFATEAAWRIVDSAVQIHGGAGLVRGSITERLYRDVRALRIYEGTSEIQKLVIARQLIDAD